MPASFDMSMEELKVYQGQNPRPDDFDAFWDASLQEMYAVDPDIELVPAAFQSDFADCFDMYFTGVKGARVYAKLLRPKQLTEGHRGLVMFHGYSSNSGSWFDKLPYVAEGFVVAAMDCRGQGGFSQDVGGHYGTTHKGHIVRGLEGPPENMLFRDIFLDTAQLARIVMNFPEVDAERVGATGGSQGGGLTLACAALEPNIKRAAPIHPFLTDYKRAWDMDLPTDAYSELGRYFVRHDPLHEREEAIFTQLGYIDVQHLAPRIKASILMKVGLLDKTCPPSTQFAAYNKITSPKAMLIYPESEHDVPQSVPDYNFEFLRQL